MHDEQQKSKANNRWIKVAVDIFDHPDFRSAYDERSAWLWLIANAAWKPHSVRIGNKMLAIERGQCIASWSFLAEKWGWGLKRVRNYVDFLISRNMVIKSNSKGRLPNIITICNYEKFQAVKDMAGQVEGRLRAGSGQVEGNTVEGYRTNRNIKDDTRERDPFRLNTGPSEAHRDPTTGTLSLTGTLHEFWLSKFSDVGQLELALIQAAGYVQPNSAQPLESQIGAQLSRIVRETADKDRRYAQAAERNQRKPANGRQIVDMKEILERRKQRTEVNHG